MKIKRFYMEDWLIDSKKVQYNLAESGSQDFHLKEFLDLCDTNLNSFNHIFLGDNVPWGSTLLREEICKSYQTVSSDQIMVSNGTSEALFAFFNVILEAGDEVIIPFPAFQSLYQVPISIGCQVRFLELREENQWKLDLNALEEMVSSKTKLIIINTPHNPFGWTLSKEELESISFIAKKYNSYLLFDEHYRYLPLEEGTELIPSGYDLCKKKHARVYATGSMIKCFGVVGIRIGWLIGDELILQKCIDYKDYLTHTIPHITDYLAYISLKNKEKIISHKKQDILENLRKLRELIQKNNHFIYWVEPTGGVVCFPKLKQPNFATDFCKFTLDKYGVSLLPGFTFEKKGHIRINFGIAKEKFQKALTLIQKSIDDFSSLNNSNLKSNSKKLLSDVCSG